jgi:hypothetical protein
MFFHALTFHNAVNEMLQYFYFSWKKVFSDPESNIDYFIWAIGSEPGYDDIMAFTREETECGQNSHQKPLDLKEGHPYYISVKVSQNRAHIFI